MNMGYLMIGTGVYPLAPLGPLMMVGDADGRARYGSASVWVFLDDEIRTHLGGAEPLLQCDWEI